MDSIDLLERRIAALELLILPRNPPTEEKENPRTVCEMLFQVNTLISSAISCRDGVTKMLNRLTELNQYLDPNYDQTHIANKKQLILSFYPDVKKCCESIQKLKSLLPVLVSVPMDVSDLVPKLEQLTVTTLELQEESQQVTKDIAISLQQYNGIVASISSTFVQFEEIVTQLEINMQPKKILE